MYEKTGGRTAGVRADGHAAAGRIHGLFCGLRELSFSDPTVSVGDQVSVTMKITSDGALGSSDVMLQYDTDALEFIQRNKCKRRRRFGPRDRFLRKPQTRRYSVLH